MLFQRKLVEKMQPQSLLGARRRLVPLWRRTLEQR
jgi:hypothetical protein